MTQFLWEHKLFLTFLSSCPYIPVIISPLSFFSVGAKQEFFSRSICFVVFLLLSLYKYIFYVVIFLSVLLPPYHLSTVNDHPDFLYSSLFPFPSSLSLVVCFSSVAFSYVLSFDFLDLLKQGF